MSDIALINKDISISNFGDIALVNDNDDIIQMAINNIMTIYGRNEFHTNIGNLVYNGRHKMSENGLKEIASECMDAIMKDNRVSKVTEVIARSIDGIENYGLCSVSFVLITVDGTQLNSNVTIQI